MQQSLSKNRKSTWLAWSVGVCVCVRCESALDFLTEIFPNDQKILHCISRLLTRFLIASVAIFNCRFAHTNWIWQSLSCGIYNIVHYTNVRTNVISHMRSLLITTVNDQIGVRTKCTRAVIVFSAFRDLWSPIILAGNRFFGSQQRLITVDCGG